MNTRKGKTVRPYYTVRHEFDDASKPYHDAALMLHHTVLTVCELAAANPSNLSGLLERLRVSNEAFRRAAFGDDA